MRLSAVASAVAIALTVASGSPAPAWAQRGEPPTPGVYNPTVGVAGDADATSIEKNPAQIGELRSFSVGLLTTNTRRSGTVGGSGVGVFGATPLPYLSSIAIGAAYQWVYPPTAYPFGDVHKLSLGLAWRIVPGLSIGLTYAHLWSPDPPVSAGIDTLDLGFAARLGRWAAAGLVIRDVVQPVVDGLPLQVVWDPEIAVRPLGDDRLELAVGARFGTRRGDIDPRFRLWFTPTRGLHVKSELEWRRDRDLDGRADDDLRFAVGLQVDFSRVGLAAFGLFGREAGDAVGSGGTVALRLSGERYPSIARGPARLEKVDLGPSTTDGRGLLATLARLRRLERDPGLAGVVVVAGDFEGGWAAAEELRAALLRLRKAKKHVFAYAAECSSKQYLVISAAEKIYLDPAGGLRLTGLSSTSLYFKGTGDLLGVRADFVKIADYKSAPEQYTRTGATPPAREQREALLDDTFRALVEGVAETRRLPAERVRALIDRGLFSAREAVAAGLADEARHADEIEARMAAALGRRVALVEISGQPARARAWARPQIAVVVVDGDITDGRSSYIPILDRRTSGMKTLIPAIEAAARDPRVRAIVLRVDSPGGSALASDLIARTLARARHEKPVVCSFGDVAASGGYYIAAPCQRVLAAPTTITGSIGIFTGKFDISGLAQKLGVSFEPYERGRHAAIESMWRPYTDEERALILDELRGFYRRFVEVVAEGRKLPAAQVDLLGRGRVWSGRAAQARGLVDSFGGFMDAVAEAKRLAGLREDADVELPLVPDEPSLLSQLARLLGINLRAGLHEDAAAKAPGPRTSDDALRSALALIPGARALLEALPLSLLAAPSTAQARLFELE
jgi:protease-4